jgi:glycine/D-amino acid oxidase-like deaminating enzyme
MASTRDVAIVGAGIIGCSIAFELAKAGMQVCVLERGGIGEESSLPPQGCYRVSMG